MKRKSILLAFALVLLFAGLALGSVSLVRIEPAFYRAAEQVAGEERKQRSHEFENSSSGLFNDITEAVDIGTEDRSSWQWTFTADQINSFFSEDFVEHGIADKFLPKGLREPRIALEKDRIRLGFRYGAGAWSSIVTVDLRVWLVSKEANVVALELQGMRAGAMPFSAQSLLEGVAETIRQARIDISPWYRHRGNPVALLRLQSERSSATARLTQLELRPGVLLIGGRSPNAVRRSKRQALTLRTAGSPQP